jgi:hypothetical protein
MRFPVLSLQSPGTPIDLACGRIEAAKKGETILPAQQGGRGFGRLIPFPSALVQFLSRLVPPHNSVRAFLGATAPSFSKLLQAAPFDTAL